MALQGTKDNQCEKSLRCVSKEKQVINQAWYKFDRRTETKEEKVRENRKRENHRLDHCRNCKGISFRGIGGHVPKFRDENTGQS